MIWSALFCTFIVSFFPDRGICVWPGRQKIWYSINVHQPTREIQDVQDLNRMLVKHQKAWLSDVRLCQQLPCSKRLVSRSSWLQAIIVLKNIEIGFYCICGLICGLAIQNRNCFTVFWPSATNLDKVDLINSGRNTQMTSTKDTPRECPCGPRIYVKRIHFTSIYASWTLRLEV